MQDIDRTDERALAQRQCPVCAEATAASGEACQACGLRPAPGRSAMTRLAETATLALALLLVTAACLAIQYLTGI